MGILEVSTHPSWLSNTWLVASEAGALREVMKLCGATDAFISRAIRRLAKL